MIGWLHGRVREKAPNGRLLLTVGPVGLWVQVPLPLWERAQPGQELELYTHLVVREDGWQLYGFASSEEVATFEDLLGVSGVGPRLALTLLSFLAPESLRQVVVQERMEVLQRLPGVGRKTARRLILSLQEKWRPTAEIPATPTDEINAQVFEALVALGYSVVEAQTALQRLPRQAPESVEERLRLALQFLDRNQGR